jgi:poly(hydroxyalkanoate) granule-associated protein
MNLIPTGIHISKPLDRLVATGRTLFLAGVGAVAEAGEGGVEMFDRLVERGRPVEERRKRTVEAVVERAGRTVRGAGQRLQDTVEHESRGMLERLNLMTREDVTLLSARLSTLSRKVDEVVARRHAATVGVIEIVSPEGETAAIVIPETVIPETSTAVPRARKASRPRPKKATR